MSQVFYEKFTSLFFHFIILTILISATIELTLFYFSTQNFVFYITYLVTLVTSVFYGLRYYFEFRRFNELLSQGLLIPPERPENSNPQLEPLNMEGLEDVSLRACLCYANKATLVETAEFLGLPSPTQAKRELINGLRILLQSYNEHNDKVTLR